MKQLLKLAGSRFLFVFTSLLTGYILIGYLAGAIFILRKIIPIKTLIQVANKVFFLVFSNNAVIYTSTIFLLASICIALTYPIWSSHFKKYEQETIKQSLRFQRYTLSMVMFMYAIWKFTGGQFPSSYWAADSKLITLSDFDIIWYLFGKSLPFTITAGIMELIPACLLLFRRTTIIGALLLLPTLVFINLIDWYYQVGDVIHWFSLAILILNISIIIHHSTIVSMAFKLLLMNTSKETENNKKSIYKFLTVTFLGVLMLLLFIVDTFYKKPNHPFTGAYTLATVTINGKQHNPSENKALYIKNLYIEKNGACYMKDFTDSDKYANAQWGEKKDSIIFDKVYLISNNQLATPALSLIASMAFDAQKKLLTLQGHNGKDSIKYVFIKNAFTIQNYWPYE